MNVQPERLDELAEYVRTHPPGPFKPLPFYSRVGDMLTWHWSEEEAYAEQINVDGMDIGHVLRSMKTGLPVGVKIYGIAALLLPRAQ